MFDFIGTLNQSVSSFQSLILIVTVVLHFIFASGVAKDIGQLHKRGLPTMIVPGYAWVLATLIMGLFGLLGYWLIHHSSFAKK